MCVWSVCKINRARAQQLCECASHVQAHLCMCIRVLPMFTCKSCASVYFQCSHVSVPWQVLQDVTGEEFLMLMRVLSSLATMSTLQGRKQLVEIVCEQADLDAPFDVGLLVLTNPKLNLAV